MTTWTPRRVEAWLIEAHDVLRLLPDIEQRYLRNPLRARMPGCIENSATVFAATTFTYGGDFNLPILDKQAAEYSITEAVIQVPDHLTIYDLDLAISLTHTNVFDLQISLRSPAGTWLSLNMYNYDEYFDGENYIGTVFDDEADITIEMAKVPFTGRFKPRGGSELEVFDGEDVYGTWRLQIYDSFEVDTGTLDSFELMVANPEPATVALLILGAGLVTMFKPRRHH